MIEIQDKKQCSGCGACVAVCPQQCIRMQPDQEGFYYPRVDTTKCVQCGLCDATCPIQHKSVREKIQYTVVAQSKNQKARMQSASGGAFYSLAETIIASGGVVYGAVFDEQFTVRHVRTDCMEGIAAMQGSKYVQSDMSEVYKTIKEDLLSKRNVLFSGTPCQVEGLKRFLRKEYPNLYTIDLVCHGVASPKVWNKYRCAVEEKHQSKMKYYSFRSKDQGYHLSGTKIVFENGDSVYTNDKMPRNDFMHLAYYDKIASRPACHSCAFKTVERVSDLTLFDCWGLAEVAPEMEDDMGATTILVHTQKGDELLKESVPFLTVKQVDGEKLLQIDGINAIYSMIPHPKRKEFFENLNDYSIETLQDRYLTRKNPTKIYRVFKQLIIGMGLLQFAQKIKFKWLRKKI